MITLSMMHTACDAAPKGATTLEEHLKKYHGGKMPTGKCKFLDKYKAEHPEEFKAAKGEADIEDADKGGADDAAKLDAEYLEAVESGDSRKVLDMFQDRVHEAFGDDYTYAYHGSNSSSRFGESSDFNVFDVDGKGQGMMWFSESERYAKTYTDDKGKVFNVILHIKNPLMLNMHNQCWGIFMDDDGHDDDSVARAVCEQTGMDLKELDKFCEKHNIGDIMDLTDDKDFAKLCKKKGIDCFITSETDYDPNATKQTQTNTYGILTNTQIKSADPVTRDADGNVIPLSKRFDFTNPDIRY